MGIQFAKVRLVGVWVLVVICILCKAPSSGLVELCDSKWWLLNLATVGLMGSLTYYTASQLSVQIPFDDAALDYRKDGLGFSLAFRTFLAGMLAAVCGIGGGMVMGPILVQ